MRHTQHDNQRWFHLLLALCLFFVSVAAHADEKSRTRLEELFVWKVSDSLSLSQKEEDEFSQALKKIRDDKARVTKEIDDIVSQMKSSKGENAEKHLIRYKELLREHTACSINEVESLEKILGPKKLAQYLYLKEELRTKLMGALNEKRQNKEKAK